MIKSFTFNPISENTYILSDKGGEAVVIDCGALYEEEFEQLATYISEQALTPVAHLLTHAHFDHVFGANYLFERYGLKPRCHEADLPLLVDVEGQMRSIIGHAFKCASPPAGEPLRYDEEIHVGTLTLKVLPSPGHTAGGVCLYCETERILFSGDSLFRESIGRTDFPGGDHWQLIRSLKSLLRMLPPDVQVYPGHGPATTIEHERQFNPYM